MNVLFVGGGRRVSLAERFILAGHSVIAYELDVDAPIGQVCPIISGLEWSKNQAEQINEDALKDIQAVAEEQYIDLCLPLHDSAVPLLSLLQTKTVCSPIYASTMAFDKKLLDVTAQSRPSIFAAFYPAVLPDEYPRIYKPRFGYGSKGIHVVHNPVEYESIPSTDNFDFMDRTKYIVQKFVTGTEYTVDAYFTKNGKMHGAVPRTRLRVADGEVVDSETIEDYNLVEGTRIIGEFLGLRGPICMQWIVDQDRKPWFIEVNARFGGGSILSLEAGFDMIDMINREYMLGETTLPKYKVKYGLKMRRVYREFFYEHYKS